MDSFLTNIHNRHPRVQRSIFYIHYRGATRDVIFHRIVLLRGATLPEYPLICHVIVMYSFIGPGNNKAKECGYKMYVNRSYNEKKQSCTKHDAHHKGIMGRHDMSTLSVVLGPVLLTLLRHVARILTNGRAAFFESCDAIGWNSCDVSQKR